MSVGILGPPLDQRFLPDDRVHLDNGRGYIGVVDRVSRRDSHGHRWYQIIITYPMRHVVMAREDTLTREGKV